ncbi:MAG: hypothetical protein KAH10_06985 [Flavobacteriales bacterium]|nr:hypothetical protein [Flavobacteriales bacterium]
MKTRQLNDTIFKTTIVFWFFVLFSNSAYSQFFYGVQQNFGKNRVVYNKFDWNYYRLPQYDVFFYQRGSRNAQYVVTNVDAELKELAKYFKLNFDERFQIICYNTLTDLKQSNLNENGEASYNTGGVTRIKGNKMFVYGTGEHNDLKTQLKAGITEMLLNYLISGSNFRKGLETYRNMSLPSWFSDGLVLYMSTNKTPEIEAKIRDGLASGDLEDFYSYTPENAKILGYSIWDFIAYKYGKSIIPTVVYMSYSNRDVKEGFESVLGIDYKQLKKDWLKYYSDYYKIDLSNSLDDISHEVAKSRNEEQIFQLTLSNDLKRAAYATNISGQYYVYLLDVRTKKKKKIFSGGYKISQNEDLSYPLIQWHPEGNNLAFVMENKGTVFLYIYDIENDKMYNRTFGVLDKINSLSFSEDGNKIVLSAVRDGFSDIYIYHLQTQVLENITKDSFDDIDPVFFNNDSEIVFSSNRYSDTIVHSKRFAVGKKYKDLFIYNFNNKSTVLKKATDTRYIDEIKPQAINDNEVAYLVFDNDQKQNKYAFERDSVVSHVDTIIHYRNTFDNYKLSDSQSILNHVNSIALDAYAQVTFHDSKYRIQYVEGLQDSAKYRKKISQYELANSKPIHKEDFDKIKIKYKSYPIDLNDYVFEDEIYRKFGAVGKLGKTYNFGTNPDSLYPDMKVIDRKKFERFKRLYRNIYFATELTTQIDQSNDNLDYQVFTGGPVFMNSGFNALFEITLADVFNNYSVTGGFRTNFQPVSGLSLSPNSEFKLQFDDRKKRWNKTYLFYRRSTYTSNGFYSARIITNKFEYKLTYPLNPVSSVSGAIAYRRDKGIYLSVDDASLEEPINYQDYATLRLDHTYDNTINYSVNLYRGFRAKTFIELYQGLDGPDNTMINIGADLRHYTRVHRNIIWANRFAAGTSLGSERLAYYLGGVDNSFNPEFDQSLRPSKDINYGFQTLMTNMRGFQQNVRHGTSFALVNSELRIPLIQYFYEAPLSWSLFRHFMVVPFFDAGTAWTGASPWSKENSLNEEIINGDPTDPDTGYNPIKITIDRQKDPIVFGYGVGLRTQVFGYFVRADWAWGVDTGIKLPRMFYFSLNLDF